MRGKVLRAPEVRIAGALALLVAAVRYWAARPLTFCGTPDACYYLGLAENLAAGQGFRARFLFDLQQAHITLPNTGIEYWRPGISLVLLLAKPFGGVNLHSSIAISILAGIVFAAAAWHVAMQAYEDRRIALGSFGFCLVSSVGWNGSFSPDSGLYYGAAVAWFLALFTVRRQGLLQDVLALGCIGLAYLVRNDAALLLLPLLAVLWQRNRLASRDPAHAAPRAGSSLLYAALTLAGFLVVLLPMHLLYRAVLGTAFPSGTAQVLFLNDLSDFSRYHSPVNLHTLLAYGSKRLIFFRIATFATVIYRIAVLMIGYTALVFLPGLWAARRNNRTAPSPSPDGSGAPDRLPEMTGPGVFFIAALLIYTLVLPAVGGFSVLRTAVGVMPLLSVLVIVAIARVARTPRLAAWLATAVIAANALSGFMGDRRDLVTMNESGAIDRAEARALAAMGADPGRAVVLTPNPIQFAVTTGYSSVVLPVNGLDAIKEAAHDMGATHVILDTEDLPGTPDQLDRQLHPVRSETLPAEHTLILALPSPSPGR